jgi:hypothetical protein
MSIDRDVTWYTAGPMSGLPKFNYPLFLSVAKRLRESGYTVVSPAELDTPKMQALAMSSTHGDLSTMERESGETWGDVLARDVKLISDQIGGIIVLPNWFLSRGARLEVFVGLLTNKQFAWWDELIEMALPLPRSFIQMKIKENMP